ncbi:MBL fold metallo-hydrolase [Chromobacterium sp. ATCC 53434]|uniref:MBL fold metallo-hydrolase n=1 Tax=Chromobacterium sp. (strain ATCC 53434 / SC 14030) TaxID=2059672 RepID=UPI000C771AD9|nr:MBL fold metallo-hydrolase [Chromobacterium sp. ATCC 53434]AUH52074.1 MBL fold metallo-hydrolase [Chromobacterium sp. ATCC 53434]
MPLIRQLKAIAAAVAIGTAALLPVAPSLAAAPQIHAQAPGYYRMMVGQFEITALSDGTVKVPLDKLLHGESPEQIRQLLERGFQAPNKAETSINAFLINTGSKLLLVDSGAGDLFGPGSGKLPANIRAAGYRLEDIDAVLLTHVHLDHSGGLTVAGKAVFPNADVYLNQKEEDFWLDPANKAKVAPEQPSGFDQRKGFDQARASLAPYLAAGRVKTFAAGAELFPGVRTIAAPGHTPGHTFYEVQSRGQRMQFWGDAVHAQQVQFARPNVAIDFDVDSATAVQRRRQAFADAARNGYWVAAAHISFPGIGHVGRDAKAFAWIPANYSEDVGN